MTGPSKEWARIRSLFSQVVDLPPSLRTPVLNLASPPGHPVRHEVDSLLAAHDRACGFLEIDGGIQPNDSAMEASIAEVLLVRTTVDHAWKAISIRSVGEASSGELQVLFLLWPIA